MLLFTAVYVWYCWSWVWCSVEWLSVEWLSENAWSCCVILLHSQKKKKIMKATLHTIHYLAPCVALKCEIDGSGGLKCLTWSAVCGSVEWCWQDRTVWDCIVGLVAVHSWIYCGMAVCGIDHWWVVSFAGRQGRCAQLQWCLQGTEEGWSGEQMQVKADKTLTDSVKWCWLSTQGGLTSNE